MSHSIELSNYGFVSEKMSLWPTSEIQERADLALIHADMLTVNLLNDRRLGIANTAFGVNQNESQVLKLATRFAYCCACGRFSAPSLDHLKNEIVKLGRKLCSKFFDSTMAEAIRFVAHEPEFMKEQRVW
ncbi:MULTISPECIES: hypothetical protein [Morganellaceae]|uniref:Uncharacterized protein n=1 Tax=Moellerella wisconsensis TaxID=158849 RepID=A0A9Q8Q3C4_9GAMM|nr:MULTISPECIES: hypothetical protein [Morganellaceae]UNH29046.1 hypothetical protein MNY64_17565 [Moellerella wisconsensis]UNH32394.1 hypothetical protein MNY72_16825 [Moellerella wisconsensis]